MAIAGRGRARCAAIGIAASCQLFAELLLEILRIFFENTVYSCALVYIYLDEDPLSRPRPKVVNTRKGGIIPRV